MSIAYYNSETLGHIRHLAKECPEMMRGYQALTQSVFENGVIPAKYKELMALTAATIMQCPYCIDVHLESAQKAGASKQEIAEAAFVATAMRAGATMAHGAMAMQLFEGKSEQGRE